MFDHFFRGHNRPLGVKRVMNTQNERREKSQENKLVAACSLVIQSSHLLKPERVLCSILTRGYSRSVAGTDWASRKDSLTSQEEEKCPLL